MNKSRETGNRSFFPEVEYRYSIFIKSHIPLYKKKISQKLKLF